MGRSSLLPDVSATGGARQTDLLRREGRCTTVPDPDLFFEDHRVADAKTVCGECPLLGLCLEHAVVHENFGVWGGTTPGQRDQLRGAKLAATPEDARWADLIRARAARGDSRSDIADAERVNMRTLERWIAADGVAGAA